MLCRNSPRRVFCVLCWIVLLCVVRMCFARVCVHNFLFCASVLCSSPITSPCPSGNEGHVQFSPSLPRCTERVLSSLYSFCICLNLSCHCAIIRVLFSRVLVLLQSLLRCLDQLLQSAFVWCVVWPVTCYVLYFLLLMCCVVLLAHVP